jgi:peptidoglycan/xylan/chitin deacetylase (PgdA/CDA1 family)
MNLVAQVVLAIVIFISFWYLLPYILRRISEYFLARRCRKHRAIVLSYDDGPSNLLTPRLLDLLAERKVQATFFVIGNKISDNSEVVARTIRDGHEVGSHSFNHYNAWKAWPLRTARDIAAGIRTVRSLGGDARLFRPPYGKQTLATLLDSLLRFQRVGWWTIDTRDARSDKPRFSVESILGQIDSSGGGVVLAHDFDSSARTSNEMSHEDYVLVLTRRIIEHAEANGYVLMRLGDVLRGDYP